MEGNQREIRKHKKDLIDWSESLQEELQQLKFEQFSSEIAKELLKQKEYEHLRAEEKELNIKIKQVTEAERKAKDEAAKLQAEDNNEILEKKKTVNETEVEAKLHI